MMSIRELQIWIVEHLGIPMKPISIPVDRDQCSGLDPISGRSEATLAVAFCGK